MKWCGNMLRKKMLRDILKQKSQFITIILMIAIGIMVYSGINAYMVGMQTTGDNFYGDYYFHPFRWIRLSAWFVFT